MKFLKESKYVFLLFVLLAVIFPQGAETLKWIIYPAIIIAITLNIYDAKFHSIGKENIKLVIKLLTINYVLLGGILILTGIIFLDGDYTLGMIMLGVAPPAITIIHLTHLLKSDTHDGALAEFFGYLLAVIVVPTVATIFIAEGKDPFVSIQIVLALVLLPMIFSKIISNKKIKYVEESGNLVYGIITYILIGLSIPLISSNFISTIPIFLILIISTFILGAGIYVLLISKHVKEEIDILYVLFATMKNGGVAGVIIIVLFSSEVLVPIGIREMLLPFYIGFLQIIAHNHHMHVRNHKHKHLKHGRLENHK